MEEWVVPVEQETGIPLALAPRDDLPPVGLLNYGANSHHAIYPKSRGELKTDSGRAVREARIQWVDVDDHCSYHHYFDEFIAEKWEFPKTINQRFGMTVLLAAGYIPEQAIAIDRIGPTYVSLNEYQRRILWKSGTVRVASESIVFEFLKDYTLEQNLQNIIKVSDIAEFVMTKDTDKRFELGNQLLDAAAMVATAEVRPMYMKAYQKKLIRPDLPKEPKDLIIDQPFLFGTEKRKRKARTLLRQRLASFYGIELEVA